MSEDETILAVRNAYRLLYGYQAALIQTIQRIKAELGTEQHWDWSVPSGTPPTRRSCPLSQRHAADFLPLLDAEFFYTSGKPGTSTQAGDVSVYIAHTADSEFTVEGNTLPPTMANQDILQSPSQATTELCVSVVVNYSGNKLSWDELWGKQDSDYNPWTMFGFGENYEGYQALKPGEFMSNNNILRVDNHVLRCFAKVAPMRNLKTSANVENFVTTLAQKKESLLSR